MWLHWRDPFQRAWASLEPPVCVQEWRDWKDNPACEHYDFVKVLGGGAFADVRSMQQLACILKLVGSYASSRTVQGSCNLPQSLRAWLAFHTSSAWSSVLNKRRTINRSRTTTGRGGDL